VEEEEIVLYLPGFCIYRPALQGCLLLKGTWLGGEGPNIFYLVDYAANIGKTSTYHTERRKTRREVR